MAGCFRQWPLRWSQGAASWNKFTDTLEIEPREQADNLHLNDGTTTTSSGLEEGGSGCLARL